MNSSSIFGVFFMTFLLSAPTYVALVRNQKKADKKIRTLLAVAFTLLNLTSVIVFLLMFQYSYSRNALYNNLNLTAEKIAKSSTPTAIRAIKIWQHSRPYTLDCIKKELEEFSPAPVNQ